VVTEFSAGITARSDPFGIVGAPDGNVWFTERADRVARITPSGTITEFTDGITQSGDVAEITVGPDHNLWFAHPGAGRLGRILMPSSPVGTGSGGGTGAGTGAGVGSGTGTGTGAGSNAPGPKRLSVKAVALKGRSSHRLSKTLATFTDTTKPARRYIVDVSWGDGTKGHATVTRHAGGHYDVSGHHKYGRPGRYLVRIRVHAADGSGGKATDRATIRR
jgi:hypothetical protein